jgi:hypothetical protein
LPENAARQAELPSRDQGTGADSNGAAGGSLSVSERVRMTKERGIYT